MKKSFWVVWRELPNNDGELIRWDDYPRVKHDDYKKAVAEQKRLAGKHPGCNFHVLRCVGTVRGEVKVRQVKNQQTSQ